MIEFSGRLVDIKRDYKTQEPVITFIVHEDVARHEELNEKELRLKIAQKKDIRSLDSNDYFHVLNRELARRLNVSEAYMKNELLGRYGCKEYIDDKVTTITTQIEPQKIMENSFLHVQCFDIRVKNGITWYSYYVLRGSHTYTTQEMAKLIDGTISECKEQGIETAPPDDLAKMQALWEQRGKV